MWDQLGTPSYMAPELWSDDQKEYDSSVDMCALPLPPPPHNHTPLTPHARTHARAHTNANTHTHTQAHARTHKRAHMC